MRRRIALVASVVLVMLAGAVGIAWASIPGVDGVIHGCYKTSNPGQGTVLVIDSAASCPSGFASLNWNQTGPQGPTGPPGPSGFQRVLSTQHFETDPSAVGRFFGTVGCPTGMQAVSAGLQEISAEQAWVDAVTSDPTSPAANARITFYEGVDPGVNNAPGELSDNPPTRYGDIAADGTGWIFNYGVNLPWYDPPGLDNTIYYDADVTVWVACVQP